MRNMLLGLIGLVMVVGAGCVSRPVDLAQMGVVTLDVQQGEGISLQRVVVHPMEDGLLIKGRIKGGYTARLRGRRLHVVMTSPDGEVVAETSSRSDVLINKRRHSHSTTFDFSIPMHSHAPEGAVIHLSIQ